MAMFVSILIKWRSLKSCWRWIVHYDKRIFLGIADMYLIMFAVCSEYLVITLVTYQAIVAVTATDSSDHNALAQQ